MLRQKYNKGVTYRKIIKEDIKGGKRGKGSRILDTGDQSLVGDIVTKPPLGL